MRRKKRPRNELLWVYDPIWALDISLLAYKNSLSFIHMFFIALPCLVLSCLAAIFWLVYSPAPFLLLLFLLIVLSFYLIYNISPQKNHPFIICIVSLFGVSQVQVVC